MARRTALDRGNFGHVHSMEKIFKSIFTFKVSTAISNAVVTYQAQFRISFLGALDTCLFSKEWLSSCEYSKNAIYALAI